MEGKSKGTRMMGEAMSPCGLQITNLQSPYQDPGQVVLQKPLPMGGDTKKKNQRWKFVYHEDKRYMTENYRALNFLLYQMVQVGHLKELVDQEKTKAEEIEVRRNPRFDQKRKDDDNALEENLPIETIHMIRGLHDPDLENRI